MAFLAVIFFSVIALVQVQGPSLMFGELAKEYADEVSTDMWLTQGLMYNF